MPDPTLDLQLTWRGTFGRVRVYPDRVAAETSFERPELTTVPMHSLAGWRIEPCDFDAVCVEFVTGDETYRVLLDTADRGVTHHALARVLGDPLPSEA